MKCEYIYFIQFLSFSFLSEPKKSDITTFVERMTSLTENVESSLPPPEERSNEGQDEVKRSRSPSESSSVTEVKVTSKVEEEVAMPDADDPVLVAKRSTSTLNEDLALTESHDSGIGSEPRNGGDLETALSTVDRVEKPPQVNRFEPVTISEEISFDNLDVQYVDPKPDAEVEEEEVKAGNYRKDDIAITPPVGFTDDMPDFTLPEIPMPKRLEHAVDPEPVKIQSKVVEDTPKPVAQDSEDDSLPDVDKILEDEEVSSVESAPIVKEPPKKEEPVTKEPPKREEPIVIELPKEEPTIKQPQRKEDPQPYRVNSLRDMYKKAQPPKATLPYQFTTSAVSAAVATEEKSKTSYVFTVPKDTVVEKKKIMPEETEVRRKISKGDSYEEPIRETNPYGMTIPGSRKVYAARPREVQPAKTKAVVNQRSLEIEKQKSQEETKVNASISKHKPETESLNVSKEDPQTITITKQETETYIIPKQEPEAFTVSKSEPETFTIPKPEPETIVIRKTEPEQETRRKIQPYEAFKEPEVQAPKLKIYPEESLKAEPEVSNLRKIQPDQSLGSDFKPQNTPTEFESRISLGQGKHMRHLELDRRHSYTSRPDNTTMYSSQTLPPSQSPAAAASTNMAMFTARGWGARKTSEPSVRDVRSALAIHETKTKDAEDAVNNSVEQAREETSKINFSPESANEQDSILEDKSIIQMANPVQRKSILKNPRQPAGHYGSAMTLNETSEKREVTKTNSIDNLSKSQGKNSREAAAEKERRKKTLQAQYVDLQSQFSRWQEQLIENQKLLANKNIVTDDAQRTTQQPQRALSVSNPTDVKEPVRRKIEPGPELRKAKSEVDVYSQKENLLAEIRRKTPYIEPSATDETVAAASYKYEPVISKRKSYTRRDSSENSFLSNPVKTSSSLYASVQQKIQAEREEQPREGSPTRTTETRSSAMVPPPPPISSAPPPPKVGRSFSAPAKKNSDQSRFGPKLDPREELMIAIRNAGGGKGVLRKVKFVTVNFVSWIKADTLQYALSIQNI